MGPGRFAQPMRLVTLPSRWRPQRGARGRRRHPANVLFGGYGNVEQGEIPMIRVTAIALSLLLAASGAAIAKTSGEHDAGGQHSAKHNSALPYCSATVKTHCRHK
jgi:hypothetical protein